MMIGLPLEIKRGRPWHEMSAQMTSNLYLRIYPSTPIHPIHIYSFGEFHFNLTDERISNISVKTDWNYFYNNRNETQFWNFNEYEANIAGESKRCYVCSQFSVSRIVGNIWERMWRWFVKRISSDCTNSNLLFVHVFLYGDRWK